eukprot:GHVS01066002.1.p1 GENE.GHVS01066002.1~~GHVS01066002.1.p1  ORF type:complete len:133 (-),score=13.61 GHVS01066002.1:121-519(-)
MMKLFYGKRNWCREFFLSRSLYLGILRRKSASSSLQLQRLPLPSEEGRQQLQAEGRILQAMRVAIEAQTALQLHPARHQSGRSCADGPSSSLSLSRLRLAERTGQDCSTSGGGRRRGGGGRGTPSQGVLISA